MTCFPFISFFFSFYYYYFFLFPLSSYCDWQVMMAMVRIQWLCGGISWEACDLGIHLTVAMQCWMRKCYHCYYYCGYFIGSCSSTRSMYYNCYCYFMIAIFIMIIITILIICIVIIDFDIGIISSIIDNWYCSWWYDW